MKFISTHASAGGRPGTMPLLKVGYFPYHPGSNPYQRLFADALEEAGVAVRRIPPRKFFPLQHALSHDVQLLQLDWPHDWYQGRNIWTRQVKRWMYRSGLRRLRRVPLVWTAHNLHGHDALDMDDERRMIQALVDVCNGIIVLSNAAEELLRREYRLAPQTRVEVIHHGHYIGCYPNDISREAARGRLGLSQSGRVVLFLGRLQPYKGLEDLIEAFTRVASIGDVLLLAGKSISDNFTSHLRRLISDQLRPGIKVELCDLLVPDDELQIYFNACDVVALPFRRVLNSGSLLLAMSFGCPVVAPRLGSIPEIACPGAWFPYEVNADEGLAAALAEALEQHQPGSFRERVLTFTAERYNWQQVGRKSADLYCALCGHESGGGKQCK